MIFDLRELALEKLHYASNGDGFITYKDARLTLGRTLHLSKVLARGLLLQMAKDGMIKFDVRGKVWFNGGAKND